MTARCALCMDALKNFGTPWLRPRHKWPLQSFLFTENRHMYIHLHTPAICKMSDAIFSIWRLDKIRLNVKCSPKIKSPNFCHIVTKYWHDRRCSIFFHWQSQRLIDVWALGVFSDLFVACSFTFWTTYRVQARLWEPGALVKMACCGYLITWTAAVPV